jgi:sulfate transport system permease protein
LTPLAVTSANSAARRVPRGAVSLALVTTWVAGLVALPLCALAFAAAGGGPRAFVDAVTSDIALDALWLTLWTAAVVAVVDVVAGTALALVLVRARVGRVLRRALSLVDALVDLPFAVPTILPGILLLRVHFAFHAGAVVAVLLFVTFPFVVRAVEPVLASVDGSEEEAAASLGASPWFTFVHVLLPALVPAILAGALQSFARAIAEFGSVVVVSGNIPHATLTSSSLVYREVESGRPERAAALSVVLLAVSLASLFATRALARSGAQRA